MLDFMLPQVNYKKDCVEIKPDFFIGGNKDLMIKGGKFYAVWDEENNIWSMKENRAITLIDRELREFAKEKFPNTPNVVVKYIRNVSSGSADVWKRYTDKLSPDNFHPLNGKVIFKNQEVRREDYSNVKTDYDLEEGEPEAYNELFSVIYSEEELTKLEWAIGAVLAGDSKKIQKFLVLYGDPGTGKGTYINEVIKVIFKGYYTDFDAKSLASPNDQFSMEPFKDNPLVAIQTDGDLSNIMDNTKLNAIVSHEELVINEKRKNRYTMKINSFLFMGTNYPVEINSSKSGINRRLIVVQPTGKKVNANKYDILVDKLKFETGKIANKCLKKYKELGKNYYNNYIPEEMKQMTDEFYNFIEEDYHLNIKDAEFVRLTDIWSRYKLYCENNLVARPLSYTRFKVEIFSYFDIFQKEYRSGIGRVRNVLIGFKKHKIGLEEDKTNEPNTNRNDICDWLQLTSSHSLLDDFLADCPAQYAKKDETPKASWSTVNTILANIDTTKLHYVRVPENHIVIDFDLKDENGEKSKKLNLEAASKFPKTYAEFSKGGSGVHLHYIYDGNVTKLLPLYSIGIEVKVFNGKSSLRRKVSWCNDIPVTHISNGLPIREEPKMVNFEGFKNEQKLRNFLKDCIDKKHHGATKPEVDFIFKALNDSYESGLSYDVRDLRQKIWNFCVSSTNQKDTCKMIFRKMKFCSKEYEEEEIKGTISNGIDIEAPIIFFDIEQFPNLLLVCWKFAGEGKQVIRMFNPKPEEVEELFKFRLIGYNNRRYDNHILYARSMGYSIEQCYNLSQKIINQKTNDAFIGDAYNISYTDVYDFAATKQSLKKWEIELDIPHKELGLDWNSPVDESLWETVALYCDNDVLATEAVFNHLKADFVAREILADISGLSVNDTTNQHTIRIIIGNATNPQREFIYTNLATGERTDGKIDEMSCFPGYIFDETKPKGEKSIYKGIFVGEGGYVYSDPGMYGEVDLLDIASMHPTSIEVLDLFGPYTKNFALIKQARIFIKHKDYESAGKLFDGKLTKYLEDEEMAEALSYALKIAINSVYGLTSATFPNKLRDPRNVDNIVAKRGALFMVDLCEEVTKLGYKVIHIKTDSIKIANSDDFIVQFVMDYGKKRGYTFEHEDHYDRICLVNNAVYIAKYGTPHKDKKTGKDIWWTATGAEFAHPYIFKTLFSKEPIEFKDLCETKAVKTDMYLSPDDENYIFVGKVGSFIPMKNGMRLYRIGEDKDGNTKYDSVTGTKDYKWMEAEYVKENKLDKDIDYLYFNNLIADAKSHIEEFGSFDIFVSDKPIPIMYASKRFEDEIPFR